MCIWRFSILTPLFRLPPIVFTDPWFPRLRTWKRLEQVLSFNCTNLESVYFTPICFFDESQTLKRLNRCTEHELLKFVDGVVGVWQQFSNLGACHAPYPPPPWQAPGGEASAFPLHSLPWGAGD